MSLLQSLNLHLELGELQKQLQSRQDALDRETQRTTALLALLNKYTGHFYLMNDHNTSHFEQYLNTCDQILARGSDFSEERLLDGSLALAAENRDCLKRREQRSRIGNVNRVSERAPLRLTDSDQPASGPSIPSNVFPCPHPTPSAIPTPSEQHERSTSPTISVNNSDIEEDGPKTYQEPDLLSLHANLILEDIVAYETESDSDGNGFPQVNPDPRQLLSTAPFTGTIFEDAREDIPLEIAIFGSGSDISTDSTEFDEIHGETISVDPQQPPVSPLWMRFALPEETLPSIWSILSDEEASSSSTRLPPIGNPHNWESPRHPSLKRPSPLSSNDDDSEKSSESPLKKRRTSSASSSPAIVRRIPASRLGRSPSSEKKRQSRLVQSWLKSLHRGIEHTDFEGLEDSTHIVKPSHLDHESSSFSEEFSEVDELADDLSLVDSAQEGSSKFSRELSPEVRFTPVSHCDIITNGA